jgi:hypothetical protein
MDRLLGRRRWNWGHRVSNHWRHECKSITEVTYPTLPYPSLRCPRRTWRQRRDHSVVFYKKCFTGMMVVPITSRPYGQSVPPTKAGSVTILDINSSMLKVCVLIRITNVLSTSTGRKLGAKEITAFCYYFPFQTGQKRADSRGLSLQSGGESVQFYFTIVVW